MDNKAKLAEPDRVKPFDDTQLSDLECPEVLSIHQIAERVVSNIITILEDRSDYEELSDQEVAIRARDTVDKISKAMKDRIGEETVGLEDTEISFNLVAEIITINVISLLEDSVGYEVFTAKQRKDKTKEIVNNMIRNLKSLVKMKLRDKEAPDVNREE